MRIAIIAGIAMALSACKEIKSAEQTATPDTRPELSKTGCSAGKSQGRVMVECADGSVAMFGAPAVHIKDGNGNSMDRLLYLNTFGSTQIILNTESKNVLSYDGSGNVTAVTRTYFDGPNCTGNAYTVPPDAVIKNKVMANSDAWPGGAQALRIVGYRAITTAASQFQSGACTDFGFSTALAKVAKIETTAFDSTDLLSIELPLELVSE